jgi:hypothetical protein
MKHKYIRTHDDQIIIFPLKVSHDTFEYLDPKSAGFISIKDKHIVCDGHSETLNLDSIIDEDSKLARLQLLGY